MKHIALVLSLVATLGTTMLMSQAGDGAAQPTNGPIEKPKGNFMKICIKIGDESLTATILNTETSRDFISLLPLNLRLTDYAGAEKISNLSRKLSTKHAPTGYDPTVGDIAYYAPWGNVVVFYKDAGYSRGLIQLGKLDRGIEKLASRKTDFDVVIEVTD
jgi:hypothetical protein